MYTTQFRLGRWALALERLATTPHAPALAPAWACHGAHGGCPYISLYLKYRRA